MKLAINSVLFLLSPASGFVSYWDRGPRDTLATLAHPGLQICRASGAG
jgi:hypothetical protein